jgi:hypothetical protein
MAGIEAVRTRRFAFSLGAATGALLLLCMAAMLVAAAPAADAAPASDSYIVVLKDDVAHPANVADRHEENRGADVEHVYRTAIKGYSAELTPNELKAVKQDPTVDYVERDQVLLYPTIQSPSFAIPRVGANTNPKLDIDEKDDAPINADIAILDTGVAPHSDLNIAGRTECVGSTGSCVDGSGMPAGVEAGHGTLVAGIAAARDNSIGVVGGAPSARIWSVRVIGDSGVGSNADILAGIDWVTAHSSMIEVANLSFGCICGAVSQARLEAVTASINQGVVYTVAAGNDRKDAALSNMASIPQVITVSAIADYNGVPGGQGEDWCEQGDADDWLANYSNFGAVIDIAAPGSCIRSTWLNNEYRWRDSTHPYLNISGTSFAAPLVAGAAAVMAAQSNPENGADVEAIRNALRSQGSNQWHDDSGDGVHEPLLSETNLTAPAMPHPSPTVTTDAPSEVGSTTAKLNGSVYPNGSSTNYYFQYGTTTAYGNTIPVSPGMNIGNGWSYVYTWNNISGLQPATTYHFRNVATNAGGTSYGVDREFKTPSYGSPSALIDQADDQMWVHSRNASTGNLQYAIWNGSAGGWSTVDLGPSIRGGTTPAPLLDNTTKQQWIYYVDNNGQLKYWNWNVGSGWKQYALAATVAEGTSPVAILDQSTKQQWVYYVDTNGQLKYWNWNVGSGWAPQALPVATAVAPGTSPTVTFYQSTKEQSVYYVKPDMSIGQWQWTSASGWVSATLGGSARPNTSPTAVLDPTSKQQWVYYVGPEGGIKYYNYVPGNWWKLYALTGPVRPDTNLSVSMDLSTSQIWLYFVHTNGDIVYWNWNVSNGWKVYSLTGPVSPGTSLAPVLDQASKQQWVYYRSAAGGISYWNWTGAGGWKKYGS